MSIARIDRFDVPPGEDEAFLAEWDGAAAPGVLHRAIRPDAPVRYVAVAGAAGAGEPYELLRELGDPDGTGGVVLIARFATKRSEHSVAPTRPSAVSVATEASDASVPATKRSEHFVAAWDALRVVLAARRGHIGARLYRGAEDFVEVAHWSSPLMLQRAERDPAVRALPGLLDAAIYQVVRR